MAHGRYETQERDGQHDDDFRSLAGVDEGNVHLPDRSTFDGDVLEVPFGGWRGILNWDAKLIKCGQHGIQKLIMVEADGCHECKACYAEELARDAGDQAEAEIPSSRLGESHQQGRQGRR